MAVPSVLNCSSGGEQPSTAGCADGVLVVAAHEQSLALQRGAEIHARMEVALTGGPLAEESDGDLVEVLYPESVARSRRMRDLSGERRGDALLVQSFGRVVDRHLPAAGWVVFVACALRDHLVDGEASPDKACLLSVLSVEHVLVLQSCADSQHGRILAERGHVEADLALALRFEEDVVDDLHSDEVVVDLLEELGVDGVVLLGNHISIEVYHSESLDFLTHAEELEVIRVLELLFVERPHLFLEASPEPKNSPTLPCDHHYELFEPMLFRTGQKVSTKL
jgi:hypothetical protein